MKKRLDKNREAPMRPEYDFSGAVRGKYVKRFSQGTNVVALLPEVAKVFPDSHSVNEALMVLVQIAQRGSKSK